MKKRRKQTVSQAVKALEAVTERLDGKLAYVDGRVRNLETARMREPHAALSKLSPEQEMRVAVLRVFYSCSEEHAEERVREQVRRGEGEESGSAQIARALVRAGWSVRGLLSLSL